MDDGILPTRAHGLCARPEGCGRVALVLQGGGALGAYQVGVYKALEEAGFLPDWVCGVSIGAINAALIAGNPPEKRLERLEEFWRRITDRPVWGFNPDGDEWRKLRNAHSTFNTITQGQPGFFKPNPQPAWASPRGGRYATSMYDTAPLRETLLELVDFDLINNGKLRFAVGAVNVVSGNFVYFDNAQRIIVPEHVMASGALPPALPMVRIGTDYFWDGGVVSNTPLQHLLDHDDLPNTLVFQVDLFSARGPLPRDMDDVMERQKEIQYSSRTRYTTDIYKRIHRWKSKLAQALSKVPEDQLNDEERRLRKDLSTLPYVTILQLIYQQKAYEGHAKDYEFSATSMREHADSGYEDTVRTLRRKDWLSEMAGGGGISSHDIHRDDD
jgi:NTE family protein